MLFVYRQNNSGGLFREPAQVVFVEADNAVEANSIAEYHGVYFDDSDDCACCGARWNKLEDNNLVKDWDVVESVEHYGEIFDYGDVPVKLVVTKAGK